MTISSDRTVKELTVDIVPDLRWYMDSRRKKKNPNALAGAKQEREQRGIEIGKGKEKKKEKKHGANSK
jgi:hypothetical protein